MKKQVIPSYFLALGLTLSLTACVEYDAPTAPQQQGLGSVSSEIPQIKADGEELALSLGTTGSEWSALTNVEWLQVQDRGTQLYVKAQRNPLPEPRTAIVTLVEGSNVRVLTLVQAASALQLDGAATSNIELEAAATQQTLVLNTGGHEWEVSTDAAWLKATLRNHAAELVIDAQTNEALDARKATLTLTHGKQSHTLKLTQAGRGGYVQPNYAWGADIDAIAHHEATRGGTLLSKPTPGNALSGTADDPFYTFTTSSALLPRIGYETQNFSDRMVFRIKLTARDHMVLRSAAYQKWLKEQGFERKTNDYFYNSKQQLHAQITTDNERETGFILFWPEIEQTESYATFANNQLPLGYDGYGKDQAAIRAWETANGGTYDEDRSDKQGDMYWAPAPYLQRFYFLDSNKRMSQTQIIFPTLHQGLYAFGGLTYPTREFEALLKHNGFDRDKSQPTLYIYNNSAKDLKLWLHPVVHGDRVLMSYNVMGRPTANTSHF